MRISRSGAFLALPPLLAQHGIARGKADSALAVTEGRPPFTSPRLPRRSSYRRYALRKQRGKRKKKHSPTVGPIPPLLVASSSDETCPPGTFPAVGGGQHDPCVLETMIVASLPPPTLLHHDHPPVGVPDDDVSEVESSLVDTVGPSEVSGGTVADGPRRLSPVVVADAASLQLPPVISACDLVGGGRTCTLEIESAASQPAGQPKCAEQSVVDEKFVPLPCATSAQGKSEGVPDFPNPREFEGPWAPHGVPVNLDVGNLADIQDDWIRVNHVSSRDMKFGADTETVFQVSSAHVSQPFRPPTKRDVRLSKSLKSKGWEDALDRWKVSAPPTPPPQTDVELTAWQSALSDLVSAVDSDGHLVPAHQGKHKALRPRWTTESYAVVDYWRDKILDLFQIQPTIDAFAPKANRRFRRFWDKKQDAMLQN